MSGERQEISGEEQSGNGRHCQPPKFPEYRSTDVHQQHVASAGNINGMVADQRPQMNVAGDAKAPEPSAADQPALVSGMQNQRAFQEQDAFQQQDVARSQQYQAMVQQDTSGVNNSCQTEVNEDVAVPTMSLSELPPFTIVPRPKAVVAKRKGRFSVLQEPALEFGEKELKDRASHELNNMQQPVAGAGSAVTANQHQDKTIYQHQGSVPAQQLEDGVLLAQQQALVTPQLHVLITHNPNPTTVTVEGVVPPGIGGQVNKPVVAKRKGRFNVLQDAVLDFNEKDMVNMPPQEQPHEQELQSNLLRPAICMGLAVPASQYQDTGIYQQPIQHEQVAAHLHQQGNMAVPANQYQDVGIYQQPIQHEQVAAHLHQQGNIIPQNLVIGAHNSNMTTASAERGTPPGIGGGASKPVVAMRKGRFNVLQDPVLEFTEADRSSTQDQHQDNESPGILHQPVVPAGAAGPINSSTPLSPADMPTVKIVPGAIVAKKKGRFSVLQDPVPGAGGTSVVLTRGGAAPPSAQPIPLSQNMPSNDDANSNSPRCDNKFPASSVVATHTGTNNPTEPMNSIANASDSQATNPPQHSPSCGSIAVNNSAAVVAPFQTPAMTACDPVQAPPAFGPVGNQSIQQQPVLTGCSVTTLPASAVAGGTILQHPLSGVKKGRFVLLSTNDPVGTVGGGQAPVVSLPNVPIMPGHVPIVHDSKGPHSLTCTNQAQHLFATENTMQGAGGDQQIHAVAQLQVPVVQQMQNLQQLSTQNIQPPMVLPNMIQRSATPIVPVQNPLCTSAAPAPEPAPPVPTEATAPMIAAQVSKATVTHPEPSLRQSSTQTGSLGYPHSSLTSSMDGKGSSGVPGASGLGKVFYFLDQMRLEVSDADKTIKNLQRDIKFMREKNKELESRKNEFERRYKEERMLREASDAKFRTLKKKIRELKGSTPCSCVMKDGVVSMRQENIKSNNGNVVPPSRSQSAPGGLPPDSPKGESLHTQHQQANGDADTQHILNQSMEEGTVSHTSVPVFTGQLGDSGRKSPPRMPLEKNTTKPHTSQGDKFCLADKKDSQQTNVDCLNSEIKGQVEQYARAGVQYTQNTLATEQAGITSLLSSCGRNNMGASGIMKSANFDPLYAPSSFVPPNENWLFVTPLPHMQEGAFTREPFSNTNHNHQSMWGQNGHVVGMKMHTASQQTNISLLQQDTSNTLSGQIKDPFDELAGRWAPASSSLVIAGGDTLAKTATP